MGFSHAGSCLIPGNRIVLGKPLRYCAKQGTIGSSRELWDGVNSLRPSATYMRRWTGTSLVQGMACRLFGTKPLPKPMLACCQLDTWEQISAKFESKFYHFHSRKCRLQTWRPIFWGGGGSLVIHTKIADKLHWCKKYLKLFSDKEETCQCVQKMFANTAPIHHMDQIWLLTHWGREKTAAISKCIFFNENVWNLFKISLKVRINNIPSLVQITAWRRSGGKP